MDTNNWRPPQVGEPAMDAGDWRSQLQPDSRQRIVNKIMDALKRHLPFSGQEGLKELKKVAVRFEEEIYTRATSQSDYLRKLSFEMLTMETKSQNTMANWRLPQVREPSMDAGDWRFQLPPDSRMDTLKRHLPFSGQEGLQEPNKIAVRFVEEIYARATSQSDYLRKISLKMLTMETKSQNTMANWRPPQVREPSIDAGDWRSQLPPDSRQRIVNKIMNTLKRHLPFSSQEGLQELKKIAVRFEEKIYTRATSQSDYLREISLKMLTMESESQNTMANWRPPQVREPSIDAGDWRSQLPPDSRQRIVNKIMDTLKRHLPFSGQEGLQELKKIAVRFEEKIYTRATSQLDYLHEISLKMLTMETESQNTMANSLQSNSASDSNRPPDPASLNSTAQTGHATRGDWKEEVYQKEKNMTSLQQSSMSSFEETNNSAGGWSGWLADCSGYGLSLSVNNEPTASSESCCNEDGLVATEEWKILAEILE